VNFESDIRKKLEMRSTIGVDEWGTFNAVFSRWDFTNDALMATFKDANDNISVKIQIKAYVVGSDISGPGGEPADIPMAEFQIDLINEAAVEECANHEFDFIDVIEDGNTRPTELRFQIAQQAETKDSITIPMRSLFDSNTNCAIETHVEF
jgi:hypothetical protein